METSNSLSFEELLEINDSANENNRNSCISYVSEKVMDVLEDESITEEVFSESYL